MISGKFNRHISDFLLFFGDIHCSYEERERRKEKKEEDGGEARGEGEGRWRVGGEDRGGYRREDREEGLEVTEEACEDERCDLESECHSAAKRARVSATFTDSQEIAIVEFVKEHPELYDKEH